MNDNDFAFGGIVGLAVGVVLIAAITWISGCRPYQVRRQTQVEAVELGHGHWVTDTKGVSVFEWGTPCVDTNVVARILENK